jgi:hypothetical protein
MENNITIEQLTKVIKEVISDTFKPNNKEIVIGQGCLTNGYVTRSPVNLNICGNPNCKSCKEWDQAMKDCLHQELKSLALTPYTPAPLEHE